MNIVEYNDEVVVGSMSGTFIASDGMGNTSDPYEYEVEFFAEVDPDIVLSACE